jgi:DivIVA domain-containing protein
VRRSTCPGPLAPDDVDAVRFAVGLRGYRMDEVDEVLDRVADDLAVRDARIAELEARLGAGPAPSPSPAAADPAAFAPPALPEPAAPAGAPATVDAAAQSDPEQPQP